MKKASSKTAILRKLTMILCVSLYALLSTQQAHSQPKSQQSVQGIIAGRDVNITQSNNSASSLPKFEGQIQAFNSKDDYKDDGKLFKFFCDNELKVVQLDIWPYYNDKQLTEDSFNQFSTPKFISLYDIEILIDSKKSDDFFFDGRQSSRRIAGYFKIVGISGPRQGIMSIWLKPVDIELGNLLKK